MRRIRTFLIAAACAVAPAGAHAQGPALSAPAAEMEAALSCPTGLGPAHEPVLLVHGTGASANENWGATYARALPLAGFDVCLVELPSRALGDIQLSSEYVVHALRRIATLSGQSVDVIGHSQGALQPRWAIKWWPDISDLVGDYVSIAGPHHGTSVANWACPRNGAGQRVFACPAAAWQMRTDSNLIAALNRGDETPGSVSYTSIYSNGDLLVQPRATTTLAGASTIGVHEVCNWRVPEHASMAADAVTYAIVLDALAHSGPASLARVRPASQAAAPCDQLAMPGADFSDSADAPAGYMLGLFAAGSESGFGYAEPPLAPYVTG